MKKFMKVLDGMSSHASGFSYEIDEVNVAENWNPKEKDAKAMGGFNFSTEDKILRWVLRGDTLYDVDVPIDAEVMEIESENAPHGVFRTNKIIVTNPRKLTNEIVMDLYLKSDLPLNSYYQCLSFLSLKGYVDVCRQIIIDKVSDRNIDEAYKVFSTFLELKEEDKTEGYLEVEEMLQEIKNQELINVCVSREPLIKQLTDANIINVTGQSGAGKSYYVKERYNNDKYLVVDTDEIFSDNRFPNAEGINRELGEMFREKYVRLPDLCNDFDLIYNEILDYCKNIPKTLVIDCAQFHAVKDINILEGKMVIIRTDLNTCYNRCIDRYIKNNKDYTDEEIHAYRERKKKIFKWYKGSNEFIKRILEK